MTLMSALNASDSPARAGRRVRCQELTYQWTLLCTELRALYQFVDQTISGGKREENKQHVFMK